MLGLGTHAFTSGMTAVSLSEILVDQGRIDEASQALAEVEDSSVTAFHANLFRYLVAVARIRRAEGDTDRAAAAAAQALGLIGAPDQYSRHPGVGAVQADEDTVAMLEGLLDTRA